MTEEKEEEKNEPCCRLKLQFILTLKSTDSINPEKENLLFKNVQKSRSTKYFCSLNSIVVQVVESQVFFLYCGSEKCKCFCFIYSVFNQINQHLPEARKRSY